MNMQQIVALALFLADEGPGIVDGFLKLFKEKDQTKLKEMYETAKSDYDRAFAESQNL